ncbi:hypothetical protein ACT2CV_07835 [Pasteurellaceae bacterium 22721_9_1]
MMNQTILNNPDNHWGKWVALSLAKQIGLLLLLSLIICYMPAKTAWKNYQTAEQTQRHEQQLRSELEHKQRLLQSLKQQAEQHQITPQLTQLLLPINQSIQQLSASIHLNTNQWFFDKTPQLVLNIESNFPNLRDFLTALLAQHPNLRLISLQIQQTEEKEYSIESDILLQLQPNKESQ